MKLALIQLIHPKIHGKNNKYTRFIILYTFKHNEFFHNFPLIRYISRLCQQQQSNHPIIRNYSNIINSFRSLEIICPEYIDIGNGQRLYTCTVKTYLLRILQRRWRQKHQIIKKRRNIKVLFNRSIHGKW